MQILSLLHPLAFWRRPTPTVLAIGWMALAANVVVGSMSTSFTKELTGAFSPLSLLFLGEFLTWSFTVLSFGFIPLMREVLSLKRSMIIPLFLVGLCSSILGPLLAFAGLMTTKAMNAELYMRSDTLFVVILAAVVLREKLRPIHAIAGAFIVAGLVVVSLRGFRDGFTFQMGDALLIGSAIAYSTGTILFKKYLNHMHADVVVFVRTSIAIGSFFLASAFMEHTLGTELRAFQAGLIVPLVGYAFLCRFVGLFTFYEAMDRLPVRTVSLILPIGTVGSLLFAWVYLGEALRMYNIVGGMLILTGAMIVRFENHFKRSKSIALEMQLENQHRQHL